VEYGHGTAAATGVLHPRRGFCESVPVQGLGGARYVILIYGSSGSTGFSCLLCLLVLTVTCSPSTHLVGTVLAGPAEFISKCWHIRKAIGGGMRQVGLLAAAGLVALQHFDASVSTTPTPTTATFPTTAPTATSQYPNGLTLVCSDYVVSDYAVSEHMGLVY
jgi:hypothetical protein